MLVGSALILGARHGDESHVQQPRTSQPIPIATLGADDMRQLLLQEGEVVAAHALWVCAVASPGVRAGDVATTLQDADIAAARTAAQRAAVERLLGEFADVFPSQLPQGVPDSSVQHDINLEEGALPPASRPFHLSAAESEEVSRQVAEYMQQRIVRPSTSPFGAPVLLVRKKDGSMRLCIDYRRLNEITRKDRFPLPLIEDLLERLVGARYFTKVDLRSGYYQVAVGEDSIQRTAFVTPEGSFEWLAMPMGLCNAPSTFQRLMTKAMGKLINRCVVVYIDDCLVYSKTFEQHLEHLRVVREAFRQHHLYARLDKCLFASDVVTFCGHVVSYNEVRMEADKVEAVRSWTPPTNVVQLRSFLGFVNYYRKFLRHIGEVAAPLTKLAGRGPHDSGHQLRLDAQQISAFEQLKALVTDEPILRMFDPTNTSLAIFCDSSDLQAGSFWAQDHGQGWQPGGFESHTLSGAESRYSARDKELLAVVQACKRWRHLIHGRPVVVYSDHQSLSLLLKGGSHGSSGDAVGTGCTSRRVFESIRPGHFLHSAEGPGAG